MATRLILMDDVPGLGSQGAEVTVADGYARNYLLPRGLAAPVTRAALKSLETLRKTREKENRAQFDEARALAERLEVTSCTIAMKAGEGDRLYGSVTAQEVAAALASEGIEIDRYKIHLPEPIKELGVFKVEVRLHSEAVASVKVWVVKE